MPTVDRVGILNAFVRERRRTPFGWRNGNDCISFTAEYGIRIGAPDLMQGGRGYRGPKSAHTKLAALGYATLEALVRDRLAEVPLPKAMRGDVAIFASDGPFGLIVALVIDSGRACAPGPAGIDMVPLASAAGVFRFAAP